MTCDGLASRPGEVEILLAASCYRNRDKLRPDEPALAPRLHTFFGLRLFLNVFELRISRVPVSSSFSISLFILTVRQSVTWDRSKGVTSNGALVINNGNKSFSNMRCNVTFLYVLKSNYLWGKKRLLCLKSSSLAGFMVVGTGSFPSVFRLMTPSPRTTIMPCSRVS